MSGKILAGSSIYIIKQPKTCMTVRYYQAEGVVKHDNYVIAYL